MARSVRWWVAGLVLALLPRRGWASGPAQPPAGGATPSVAAILNADGTLRPGGSGSFSAAGYELVLDAATAAPRFRPAGAKGTLGAGDANWQSAFGYAGASGLVRAVARASNGDLYIGGDLTTVGTVPASRVAKWNGTAWSALGTGLNNAVQVLAATGSGQVAAGGTFTAVGDLSKFSLHFGIYADVPPNQAPVIAAQSRSVAENTAGGTAIGNCFGVIDRLHCPQDLC